MASAESTKGLSLEQMRDAIATLSSPDRIESPFGTLNFFDGVPTPETVTTIYDALDLMRGIEVFLNGVPGASLDAKRRGMRSVGITSPHVIGYTDPRANSGALGLTTNTETTYGTTFYIRSVSTMRPARAPVNRGRNAVESRERHGRPAPYAWTWSAPTALSISRGVGGADSPGFVRRLGSIRCAAARWLLQSSRTCCAGRARGRNRRKSGSARNSARLGFVRHFFAVVRRLWLCRCAVPA
jgi:hypothetical protein